MTTKSSTLTTKSESMFSEDAWRRTVTTRITTNSGFLPTSFWSILEPPISTKLRTFKEKRSIYQTLLDRSSISTHCSRVSTQFRVTSPAGETISYKLYTTWSTYLIPKTLGCTSFYKQMILSPRWGNSSRRQLRRTFVQAIDVAALSSFAKKPTPMTTIPNPDMVSLSSSWRASSSSWMWFQITSSLSCKKPITSLEEYAFSRIETSHLSLCLGAPLSGTPAMR